MSAAVAAAGAEPGRFQHNVRRPLTRTERAEAAAFPEVFFVPTKHYPPRGTKNGGYDDDSSRYLTSVGDHVAFRFEIQTKLGKGAFGDVFQAFDHKTNTRVALKIIRNEHRFNVQGRVEVDVLDALRSRHGGADKHCCVRMVESFVFRGHMCITFDLHGHDLYTELKARDFHGLGVDDVRTVVLNIVTCLRLLRRLRIVHADLKPENVLLTDADDDSSCDVRVIDFGSSCFEHGRVHTYVQSRYYRSPEIVLGLGYGTPVDMWSLGCIIVELLTGRPMFSAKNEKDLLLYHMEVLGVPPAHILSRATRTADFFSHDRTGYHSLRVVDRKGRKRLPRSRDLALACRTTDADAVDFVRRCLCWAPDDRLTPEQALEHPFLATPARRRALLTPTNAPEQCGSTNSLDDSGLDSVTSMQSEDYQQGGESAAGPRHMQ